MLRHSEVKGTAARYSAPVNDAAETMTADDVADLAGCSRRTVDTWLHRRRRTVTGHPFPEPGKLDGRNVWSRDEVTAWLLVVGRLPLSIEQWAARLARLEPGSSVDDYIIAIAEVAPSSTRSARYGVRYRPAEITAALPTITAARAAQLACDRAVETLRG